MSNEKYINIDELLHEDDIKKLTEKTFSKSNMLRVYSKKIASIAACSVLLIGILNFNTVYANVQNMFSYMFGVGLVENENLNYFILQQPIEFGDDKNQFIVDIAYRNGNTMVVSFINKGEYAKTMKKLDCKLIIDGKIYNNNGGGLAAATATVSENDKTVEPDILENKITTELTFENIPKANHITFVVNDTYKTDIALVETRKFTGIHDLFSASTSDYTITAIPLSSENQRFGIDIKPIIQRNSKLKYSFIASDTYFVDEYGNECRTEGIGVNGKEIKPKEQLKGKIVALKGTKVIMSALSPSATGLKQLKLPNPLKGQRVDINQTYDIYGLPLTIKSISCDENGLLTLISSGKCDKYTVDSVFFSIDTKNQDIAEARNTSSYYSDDGKDWITEFTGGQQCIGDSITIDVNSYDILCGESWQIQFK